ncbi:hypothetical protein JY651_49795 [Pyxidicoccus parkwayensis]|uniref:DUF3153 domain-containing protein n=1 Tax=Pyxidicoccus parkwayensis TaxID=2813578 RepID=A0ABX7NVY1_9BACT|nr:hypothetical protein [Pyxidicoccus parkwaysis]QSQ23096.1 hypothetical protein JY651_49795 [Pyxidicoccus parkwaysis]
MSSRSTPRPPWLLATLALVTLTGCFDLVQEVWINPDGSARVVLDVGIPKSLVALGGKHGGQDLMEQVRQEQEAAKETLSKDPNVEKLEQRTYEEGDRVHVVHDLTVRDATKLPELYRKLADDASRERQRGAGNWDFRIERDGGDYVFTQRFVPDKAVLPAEGGDPAEQAAKELAKGMAKALLVNNNVTLRVHGPSIGETNGTVNEKKDTVEWKMPLSELVDAPAGGREFRAVVHGGEPLWLWPIVIGVPLAVLGLAIAAARRKRRAAAYGQ